MEAAILSLEQQLTLKPSSIAPLLLLKGTSVHLKGFKKVKAQSYPIFQCWYGCASGCAMDPVVEGPTQGPSQGKETSINHLTVFKYCFQQKLHKTVTEKMK